MPNPGFGQAIMMWMMIFKTIFYFVLVIFPLSSIAVDLEVIIEKNKKILQQKGSFTVLVDHEYYFGFKSKSLDFIEAENEYLNNLNDLVSAELEKYCDGLDTSLRDQYNFNFKKHSFFDDGYIFISQVSLHQIEKHLPCNVAN